MAQQTIDIGSAPNDGTGDPIRDAFDKCNDNFTELYGSLAGLLDFQGATDCSANPNYPAASQGDIYIVSVAGKIGGASGKVVEVGDFYLALADNAGGTEASVGTSWAVLQANITGGIGAGVDVEDEGVSETAGATILNFTGAGVTASDAGGGQVDINIPGGGGGGVDVEDEGVAEATGATTLNFTGAGVTATDVGGGQVDVAIPGGAGSLVFLGTTNTLSSGSLQLTGLSLSLYAMLEFCFEDLTCATAGFSPRLRFSCGSGFVTTNTYDFGNSTVATSGSTAAENAEDSGSGILGDLTANFSSTTYVSGHGRVYNPGGASNNKLVSTVLVNNEGASGVSSVARGMVRLQNTAAIDGILLRAFASAADRDLTGGRLTAWGWLRS